MKLRAFHLSNPKKGLQALRKRYPWPVEKPNVPPDYTDGEPTGWCYATHIELFSAVCNEQTKIVLDGGSWLGLSASRFLLLAPNATVICIDHWKGSEEHQSGPESLKLSTLYETFLVNLWEKRDRIIPVRAGNIIGMQEVASLRINPDVVYVDWSHDADSVCSDLLAAREMFPRATLIGDDWSWESVREGVQRSGLSAQVWGGCYKIE